MVAYFGFDKKIGNVSFYDSTGRAESGFQKPYSEQTSAMIDAEVRDIVQRSYDQAKTILGAHKKELKALADLLLIKEIIFRDDVEKLLGKRIDKLPILLAANE